MDVFDLFAKLSLDTSEYDKGLTGAETKASDFGTKFASAGKAIGAGFATVAKVGVAAVGAATAVTGAFVSGAKEAASYGDNIDKMSQKLGMSAEAYQEWDAVMQHSGTTIESMQRGMTTLAKAAETDSDAFKQLGISQEELAGLSQEELFAKTIEGLQGMEAGTERTVLAQKLLGGSAKELGALLNTSAEETQAMRDRVHELGGVMSDEAVKASAKFQDNLQDLQTAISGIQRGLTSELLPSLNLIMEGFTALLVGEEGGTEKFSEGFSAMLEKVGDISGRVVDILKEIVPSIASALGESLPEVVSFGVDLLTSIVNGIANNIDGALDMIINLVGIIFDGVSNALPSLLDTLISKIPDIIVSIADAITAALPVIIDSALAIIDGLSQKLTEPSGIKKIITAGVNLIVSLGNGIIKAIPRLVKMIPQVISGIVSAITDNLPTVLDGVISLVNGIVTELPNLILAIGEALPELIQMLADYLVTNLPILINGIVTMIDMIAQNLPDIIDAIITILPDLIGAIVDAMIACLPVFIQGTVTLVTALAERLPEICMALIEAIPQIIAAILVAFEPVVDGIGKVFGDAWANIQDVFSKVPDWFKGKFDEAKNSIKEVFDKTKDNFQKAWEAIKTVFATVGTWFKAKFETAVSNIKKSFETIGSFFENIWTTIKEAFHIDDAIQWGKDMIANFVDGIKKGWGDLKDGLGKLGQQISDFIGFSEPKEGPLSNFHTYAPDMLKLFAEGVNDNANIVTDAVANAFDFSDLATAPTMEYNQTRGGYSTDGGAMMQKVVDLLQEIVNRGVDVELAYDPDGIFRVVERQNKLYTATSGYNRLSMTEV